MLPLQRKRERLGQRNAVVASVTFIIASRCNENSIRSPLNELSCYLPLSFSL